MMALNQQSSHHDTTNVLAWCPVSRRIGLLDGVSFVDLQYNTRALDTPWGVVKSDKSRKAGLSMTVCDKAREETGADKTGDKTTRNRSQSPPIFARGTVADFLCDSLKIPALNLDDLKKAKKVWLMRAIKKIFRHDLR